MQASSHILMIRPVNFGFNAETAVNNLFQVPSDQTSAQENAVQEFDNLVATLRKNEIDVTVVQDSPEPYTPDSIFPNNWISFLEDGTIFLYPMFAQNRRAERKESVLEQVNQKFIVNNRVDLTFYESQNLFLEGTGSMVLDRDHNIAYACLSQRTDKTILADFCKRTGYSPISFIAVDAGNQPIYHTNVMMCVADAFVVICLDCIPDPEEKELVSSSISASGKKIIEISLQQMEHFAGNMLQVENIKGEKLLVMSSQAYQSLTKKQITALNQFNRLIHSDISTIETNGGGSARCMIAEVFLPVR